MQNVFFPSFLSHSQGLSGKVVPEEIKSFPDPAYEGLVGQMILNKIYGMTAYGRTRNKTTLKNMPE
jgi:hypothetical protein